ncbi:MAG: class I SAM-dependent methyltransferase [Nocardioidaceae bacterium]
MRTDELGERLFTSVLGMLDVLSIHVGDQLGLYRLLHDAGPLDEAEVARRAGLHPRYAREWLEQQVVAGLLAVDEPTAAPQHRRYSLPGEHAPVLCDAEDLAFLAPFARMMAAAAGQLPALLTAYRDGGGVPWEQFGPWMRTGQAAQNRPLFLQVLGREWLPSLPEVHRRLLDGGRVADIGCGEGWSAIGTAIAYPAAQVDGFDVDAASLQAARHQAAASGLQDRVRFHHVDGAAAAGVAGEMAGEAGEAGGQPGQGRYDLVTLFECVHDLPDPVAVLAGARRLLAPGGVVLVMDERVPDRFTGAGDPVEQLMYGFSLFVCLPDSLSHPGSVGTGTVMRPEVLRGYAEAAGLGRFEVLPVEHEIFRLYLLRE